MRKMPAIAADLPNAVIRFLPNLREVIEQRQLHGPAGLVRGKTTAPCLMRGVDDLAVDVELQLKIGRVSDAYGPGAFIAGEPARLQFNDLPFAGQSIQDLDLLRASGHRPQQPFVPSQRGVV